MLQRMPTASRRSFFSRPPLPLFAPLSDKVPLNPLDALPAAINHLLAAEPWARAQLVPHVGKTLHVIVSPFTIRLAVATDRSVVRAANTAVADTTVTLPHSAIPRMLAGGGDAAA